MSKTTFHLLLQRVLLEVIRYWRSRRDVTYVMKIGTQQLPVMYFMNTPKMEEHPPHNEIPTTNAMPCTRGHYQGTFCEDLTLLFFLQL